MLKNILVPLDGSQVAETAIPFACKVVDKKAGYLHLFMVVDVPERVAVTLYPTVVPFDDYDVIVDRMLAQAQDYLEGQAATLKGQGYNVSIITAVDEPAQAIVEHAEAANMDAIVMSTHGRSGLSRWLFGSITSKVLGAATCPVMVVPAREQPSSKAEE